MTQYDKLKKKYDELIRHSLEKNKRILIESFVEYYGEHFRYIIEKRYNEITFVYYIDWDTVDLVVNEFIPQVNNPDKYADFINFSNSRKESFLSKIFKRSKKKSKLPDNLIGMTNPSIINKDAIVTWLFNALSSPNPRSYNYGSVNHMDRLISFQILTLNERAIIHEINHAITRDNIAYIMDNDHPIGAISKNGLSVDICHQNSGERNGEELLNEKASEDIEKIFKLKGGDLSDFCFSIPLEYAYEHNFYLVDNFYKQFKEYLKTARISDNKNELVSRIGQKDYEEFMNLINEYYTEDLTQIESRKEKVLPIIRKLLEKMSKNVEKSHTPSEDETNAYLEQLQKSGYSLRMMNDIQNNEIEDPVYENENGNRRR